MAGAKVMYFPVAGAPIRRVFKGHLFGDIFGRDNLDFQSRELATISALACMQGVNPQLQSHFNVGLNTGLTEAQLRSLVTVLEANVGKKEAANANETLGKVLSNRQAEQNINITRSACLNGKTADWKEQVSDEQYLPTSKAP